MSGVPAEIDWCVYVRGDESSADKGTFVVEYRHGMEAFRYEEIARDEEGVFLLAENGDQTRILGAEDMFEDAGDLSLVRLEITRRNLEIAAQYDIVRHPGETAAYGA